MSLGRITKRAVDALEPGSRDVFLWDEDLSGFGVRVTPAGHKSYVLLHLRGTLWQATRPEGFHGNSPNLSGLVL